uniref:PNT domain-containing protein n=1 Tax=Biomphalaria glabrata TaxID=6526 RepID=A0A2C9JVQ9_BIOGL
MALGYERPVTYESYAPPHFLHYDSMNIKKEPGTFDYHKRSSENSCMYSSMESKRYLAKGKPLPSDCELNSWVNKHPKHWTKTEVLDWIYSVVETDHLDGSKVQGEAYREFTGERLYKMSKTDFENVDPNYGSKMYDTFRGLINNISFEKPSSDLDVNLLDDFNAQNCDYSLRFNKDILERFRPSHPHSENNFSRNKRNGFSQNDTSQYPVYCCCFCVHRKV